MLTASINFSNFSGQLLSKSLSGANRKKNEHETQNTFHNMTKKKKTDAQLCLDGDNGGRRKGIFHNNYLLFRS